jgi:Ca2+-transporting ATPase
MSNWYKLETDDVLQQLEVAAATGLDENEVTRRRAEHGSNELVEQGGKSKWRILWEQFTATMVLLLIVAAAIAGALGEYKDMVAILAIVILFGLLGFFQEYRAEKAIAALKKLATPNVRVRRGGQLQDLSARDLVPGDIILLETGNMTPADCRLLESVNLRIQEAALTGESEPVEKMAASLAEDDLPLGDRRNLAYMGTLVTYGRGEAVVTETGMKTELGHIATLLQEVTSELTPLQRRLDDVGKQLAIAAVAIGALIFLQGWLRGEEIRLLFLTMVSIAVAIIPEGLPAVVTITLALGAQRMLKRHALIRKLPAVETLGSVTVICSDKTGTLTENRMTVTVLDVAGQRLNLAAEEMTPADDMSARLNLLLLGGALCNDAVPPASGNGAQTVLGDPTEVALILVAAQFGLSKPELERTLPRVDELPFDSERKRMTTLHRVGPNFSQVALSTPYLSLTKGAVDGLLQMASHVYTGNNQLEPLDEAWRERIETANTSLAGQGMRVLGVAYRALDEAPPLHSLEQDLVFVGMIGMIDPPRSEAKHAVATCRSAGIRPVMITGDHPLTAQYIARELGIMTEGHVLTGSDLEQIGPGELHTHVDEIAVYARVSPEHKLRVVEALQNRGHIVAMTGDGVNDAPALKRANIGVAMGITGTDVSKEAADMVLRDDNFATIVAAVEEGRIIYDNLRKFIKFSLAGNIGKVAVMIFSPLLALLASPAAEEVLLLPLLPLQLLWLNLLTDGLLGLGLGFETGERNVMCRPPRDPEEGVFSRGGTRQVIQIGLLITLLALGLGYGYAVAGHAVAQTMIFTTLALAQVWQALAVRSEEDSLFSIGLLSNKPLFGLALLVVALQLLAVYVPFLQEFFQTRPLSLTDLALSVGVSSLVLIAIEIEKGIKRGGSQAGASSH